MTNVYQYCLIDCTYSDIQNTNCYRNLLEKTSDTLLKAAKIGDLKMVR